jgi:hypothetical protein
MTSIGHQIAAQTQKQFAFPFLVLVFACGDAVAMRLGWRIEK